MSHILATGQKITLTYDQRGQLTRAALSGGRVITYTIDGEGKRLSRSADGILTAYYFHDFAGRLTAEIEIGGALRTHFVYASQSHSPDYMIKGGAKFYFAKDQLGSIRAVVNADTGFVAQAIHYDEFGKVLADSNPGFQPFGFAGGHFDYETGLVRFGARDYDAEVGRWLSKDPILFAGGDGNLYSYVANDPINWIDPSGEFLVAPIVIGGLVSGGIELGSQLIQNGGNLQCVDWGSVAREGAIGAALGGVLGNINKFGKVGQSIGKFGQRALQNTPIGPGGSLNRGAIRIGIGNHNKDAIFRLGLPGKGNKIDLINLGRSLN